MNNIEFANKCIELSKQKTIYMNGTFCQNATTNLLNSCAKRIPSFYTTERINSLRNYIDKGYIAADCVGLIKGIVWGYPQVKYASNGLNDTSDDGLIQLCKEVSYDFSNLMLGEIVWIQGHVGVYIGNAQVCECTTRWSNNVLISNLENLGNKTGNSRTWVKHGKLPMIEYLKASTGITYRGHVQDIGWLNWVNEDQICGTIGQGKRLEAIQINPNNSNIYVKAHIQDMGWIDYGLINKDTVIGTVGQSKRIESLDLNGAYIKCHIQDIGWVDNYSTLQETMGLSYRLEAVKIKLNNI